MIICTTGDPEQVEVSVWMDPAKDRKMGHRHDIVKLSAQPALGSFLCTAMADLGLPVLQPRSVRFVAAQRLSELFLHRAGSTDSAESLATALAAAVFLRLTGIPGIIQGGATPVDSANDIVDRFESFLRRESPQNEPVEAGNTPSDCIVIPRNVAIEGLENNVFHEKAGRLYTRRDLGLDFERGGSALECAEMMQAHWQRSDYGLPDGFLSLDLEIATEALSAIEVPNPVSVHYYADARSPTQAWRLQAALSYPLLAEYMTQYDGCRNAIDAGTPLQPVLSELTGLNKGQLRRLGKVRAGLPSGRIFEFGSEVRGVDPLGLDRARRYALGGELSLERFLTLIKQFDAGWIPVQETAWKCLIDIVSCCILPLSDRYPVPAIELLAASKGDWISFHAQLCAAYDCEPAQFDRQHMSMAISDIMEMTDDFSYSVVLPRVLAAISEADETLPFPSPHDLELGKQLAFQLMIDRSKNPVATALDSARRWMSRIPALIAAEDNTAANGGVTDWERQPNWPRLTTDFTASCGLVIQNLVSEQELLEESSRLSHCVGRLYTRKARRGDCHIFSVRNPDRSQSLSTFEVAPPVSDVDQITRSNIRIVQHKARKNRKPGELPGLALGEWLDAIRSLQHPINLKEVRDWRKEIEAASPSSQVRSRSPADVWSDLLGRNHVHPAVREAIWEQWSNHILRGDLARGRDSGVIFRRAGSRQFLGHLNPMAHSTLMRSTDPEK